MSLSLFRLAVSYRYCCWLDAAGDCLGRASALDCAALRTLAAADCGRRVRTTSESVAEEGLCYLDVPAARSCNLYRARPLVVERGQIERCDRARNAARSGEQQKLVTVGYCGQGKEVMQVDEMGRMGLFVLLGVVVKCCTKCSWQHLLAIA